MSKKGIDISSWQGNVDFLKIKEDGIDFVVIRCGFGSDLQSQDDKYFESNVRGCEKNGIPWGVYLYSYARNLKEARSEVSHVLRLLKGKKPEYPVYIDMEDADGYKAREKVSSQMCSDICELFCVEVEKAGYYPGIYANKYWLDTKLDLKIVSKWDVWLAQWTKSPSYSKSFQLWQYTSGGVVAGISGKVDMNLCYVDYPEIIKSAEMNGWSLQESGNPKLEQAEGHSEDVDRVGSSKIREGDKVNYAGKLYSDSYGGGAGKVVEGEFTVSKVIPSRKCGVLLDSELGWVSEAECSAVSSDSSGNAPFKVGDIVKIGVGVNAFYDGTVYAEFLKKLGCMFGKLERTEFWFRL